MQVNSTIRTFTALYDFAIYGGSIGEINLKTPIPAKTILISATYVRIINFASAGAAVVSFGITGNNNCLINTANYGAFLANATVGAATDITRVSATGVTMTMTISTASITQGKFLINVIGACQDI